MCFRSLAATFDPGRAYLVSEFGPDGYWNPALTDQDTDGGLREATGSANAERYTRRWTQHVEAHRGANVGGFAFCWRDRFEGSKTWFGLIDERDRRKPAYDALQRAAGGAFRNQPGRYHNGGLWPMITGFWALAARKLDQPAPHRLALGKEPAVDE